MRIGGCSYLFNIFICNQYCDGMEGSLPVAGYMPPYKSYSFLANALFDIPIEIISGIATHFVTNWIDARLKDRSELVKLAESLFGKYHESKEWGMIVPDPKFYGLNKPPYSNADKALKQVWSFLTKYYDRNLLSSGREHLGKPNDDYENRVLIGSAASNPESKKLHDILQKNFKMPIDDLGQNKEDVDSFDYIKENKQLWPTKRHTMYCEGKKLQASLEPNPKKEKGHDYLMISRVPNLFGGVDKEDANDVLIVAGLQSVGTGGATLLFGNKEKLIELHNKIKEKNTTYFQALYKVEVIRGQKSSPENKRLEYVDVKLVDNQIYPLK